MAEKYLAKLERQWEQNRRKDADEDPQSDIQSA